VTLVLVTAPSTEPVTALEARTHARVENSLEDPDLVAYIAAARAHAERITGRQVAPATWDLLLPGFPPDGCPIRIPKPPLKALSSITYRDTDGDEQTWAAENYTVFTPGGESALEAHVVPGYGKVYPATLDHPTAVTVTFEAGYVAVPPAVRSAILAGVGELYLNRERPDLAKAMDALLRPFKVWS
jgi:uncharacterized phiE125 gp8 family phage protein